MAADDLRATAESGMAVGEERAAAEFGMAAGATVESGMAVVARGATAESGQAMIFVALLLPLLLLITGLGIEAGHLFAEQQRIQAVADISALVAAQDLPCATSDSACILKAETRGCSYAGTNGFSGCTPAGSSVPSANVPPVSCSPYDFDYGNVSPGCLNPGASSQYNYVEVRLREPVAVPLFGTLVNLNAHAIARHGVPSSRDFAVAVLDPSQDKALDFALTTGCYLPILTLCPLRSTGTVVSVGDVMVDSNAAHAIAVDGDGTGIQVTCSGRWLTYANEIAPSGLASYANGTADIAPTRCTSPNGADNPTAFLPNQPRVDDPYASSQTPAGHMANCTPCTTTAWAYHWTSLLGRTLGTWVQADHLPSPITSDNWEFFPGIYPNGLRISASSGLLSSGGNIYFNPGVYTMRGDLRVNAGTVCLYGAPACDETTNNAIPGVTGVKCWNASFDALDPIYTLSSIWYHFCSPYGVWDTTPLPHRPAGLPTTAPTFTDGRTPLNGVTFYMDTTGSGSVDMETASANYLAAPNPCPGTGADTLLPIASDAFPQGSSSSSSTYLYLPTSLAGQDAILYLNGIPGHLFSPAKQLYPNVDFSVAEDQACTASIHGAGSTDADVWTGEFPSGVTSHLHFLVFQRDASHGITLKSSGQQYWWGILYNPGNYASGGGCTTACAVQVNGQAATGPLGAVGTAGVTTCSVSVLTLHLSLTCAPPTVLGQIVADNVSFTGDAPIEIYYRPGSPVGGGPGTSLIQ